MRIFTCLITLLICLICLHFSFYIALHVSVCMSVNMFSLFVVSQFTRLSLIIVCMQSVSRSTSVLCLSVCAFMYRFHYLQLSLYLYKTFVSLCILIPKRFCTHLCLPISFGLLVPFLQSLCESLPGMLHIIFKFSILADKRRHMYALWVSAHPQGRIGNGLKEETWPDSTKNNYLDVRTKLSFRQWLWLSWQSCRFRHQKSTVWIQSLAIYYIEHLFNVIWIEKTKIKKKMPGIAHFKKYKT